MPIEIVEFKAKVADHRIAEQKLLTLSPDFRGTDNQVDTYFNVSKGRLKLREGNIESSLIWYERPDEASSKLSQVRLYKHTPSPDLKELLANLHGIKVIVEKARKIYFIENVKFHFDTVPGLGDFIEVEAISENGSPSRTRIQEQCDHYAAFLQVSPEDYMSLSYSDMLLTRKI